MDIAEWAEEYRIVSSEEAAAPGPWRNNYAPYTVDVMKAISDPFARGIVMMWGAQLGKTNVLGNTIGYHIHLDPCPIMIVEPTIELAESWSGKRFAAMIRDMPCLRERIPSEKGRTPGNTLREKIFPGGYLTIAGANSAPSLKSRPIRVVLFDEVDEAPVDLDG
jgi:phage terminase large subunit GpA-like protein